MGRCVGWIGLLLVWCSSLSFVYCANPELISIENIVWQPWLDSYTPLTLFPHESRTLPSWHLSFTASPFVYHFILQEHQTLFHPEAKFIVHGEASSLTSNELFTGHLVYWKRVNDTRNDERLKISSSFIDKSQGSIRLVVSFDSKGQVEQLDGVMTLHDAYYTLSTHNRLGRKHFKRAADDSSPPKITLHSGLDEMREPFYSLKQNQSGWQYDCGVKNWNSGWKVADPFVSPFSPRRMADSQSNDSSSNNIVNMNSNTISALALDSLPTGCPTSPKILYMGVVADCSYVQQLGSVLLAKQEILRIWLLATGVYEKQFNILLGIINLILEPTCGTVAGANTDATTNFNWNQLCSDAYTISQRLSDFSQWRAQTQNSDAGLYHLMSQCSTGATIGLSWLNMVCRTTLVPGSSDGDQVTGAGVSTNVGTNPWLTVTHEIGHSFGAVHDCIDSNCPSDSSGCCTCGTCSCQGQYIMNPSSSNSDTPPTQFSPCSQLEICSKMPLLATCLSTPGSRPIISAQQCGNGIKEPGEQCDCGDQCALDTCCTVNCTLKAGADCCDFNDDCCYQCHIMGSATAVLPLPSNKSMTCHPATGPCDKSEMCSGSSATCPADIFVPDTTPCDDGSGDGTLQCASGQCTSRARQCLLLGSRQGVTGDCSSTTNQCQITCQSANSSMSCIAFDQNYIDGTPCGLSGVCQAGNCQLPDLGTQALAWIKQNPILTGVIGGIIGISLLSCCCSCIVRKKRAFS